VIAWQSIDEVLLDMDGTLLDLNFDNHFWREHLPRRYAERFGLDLQRAKEELQPRFRRAEGTIQWYCLDYWTRELGLEIAVLKREVQHLIAVHPHVLDFLNAIRGTGKRAVLVTNAHHESLALKLERTRLGGHFDAVVCAHDLGLPKEDVRFWDRLQSVEPFSRERSVLIDDSLPALRSAHAYGIRHLLAVRRPDTRGPSRDVREFPAVDGFHQLFPVEPATHRTA
jgi:HAD superfamily hydrolase (TIGR01509 family)